jgi:hypothetical protein
MSTLLFLCELIAFAVLAYWTFSNDNLGPKAGTKGLLKMMDAQEKQVEAPRKAEPKWRQNHRPEPVRAQAPSRWGAKPAAQEPSWKRRLG